MTKRHKIIDYIFLTLLGILLFITYYDHFTDVWNLSINNYLSIAAWILVLGFRVFTNKGIYGVFVILLLGAFNVIDFTTNYVQLAVGVSNETSYRGISVNGATFILLLVYIAVNYNYVKKLVKINLYGSQEEQAEKAEREFSFYYQNFQTVLTAGFKRQLIDVINFQFLHS